MEKFDLAPAEWNIMECLWERAPQTGRELTEQLEASMGWSWLSSSKVSRPWVIWLTTGLVVKS